MEVQHLVIILTGARTGHELPEISPFLILLGDDIDRLHPVAVVKTRELALIAEVVEYLYLVDDIRRQIARRHFGVVTKKSLPVDQYPLHGLSLRRHVTRFIHLYTRHLLQQVFRHGIWLGGKHPRTVFHRILFYGYRRTLHHHRRHHITRPLHVKHPQVEIPVRGAHRNGPADRHIPLIGYLQVIGPRIETFELKYPLFICNNEVSVCGVAFIRCQRYGGIAKELRPAYSIYECAFQGAFNPSLCK